MMMMMMMIMIMCLLRGFLGIVESRANNAFANLNWPNEMPAQVTKDVEVLG